MELKLENVDDADTLFRLLIVPYGIETLFKQSSSSNVMLLIVPYGIETIMKMSLKRLLKLLIVPYGIETTETLLRF